MNNRLKFILINVLLVLVTFVIVIGVSFYERIGIQEGLGFDGENYALLSKSIVDGSIVHVFDSYSVQRYSVPALVGAMALLFDFELTNSMVAHLFVLINLLCLFLSVFFFYKICSFLKFDLKTTVFAFVSIFCSYFILKMMGYYPVLLDYAAFTIGLVLFYAYLSNNFALGLISIFIGAFTFPSIGVFGILLFASRNIEIVYDKQNEFFNRKEKVVHAFKALFPYLMVLLYVAIVCAVFLFTNVKLAFAASDVNPIRIIGSAFATGVMIYSAIKILLVEEVVNLLHLKKIKVNKWSLFILFSVFLLVKVVIYLLANHEVEARMSSKLFLVFLSLQSIQNPFSSIVSHVMYFGPVLVIAVLFFKSIAEAVRKEGVIFTAIFALNILIMILGNESRQFVVFVPVLIFYTCHVIKEKIDMPILVLHCVTSLFLSRFWFTINSEGFGRVNSKMEGYSSVACQRYFMSQGPWMSDGSYTIFILVCAVVFFIYWYLFRKSAKNKVV